MNYLKVILLFLIVMAGNKLSAQSILWQSQGNFEMQNIRSLGSIGIPIKDTTSFIGFNNRDSLGCLRIRPADGLIYVKHSWGWASLAPISLVNTKLNIADTAAMLVAYLRKGDTANMLIPYLRKLDTASMSTRINQRVRYTDTASMLAPYLRDSDTTSMLTAYLRKSDTASISNRINSKVNIADTALMLSKYLRKSDTTTLSVRINSKVNISDTSSMLTPYLRKGDTTNMLSPYLRKLDTASLSIRINSKVNISDTALMLSKYLRKSDTSTLSVRINSKVNISDTSAMLSPYMRDSDTSSLSNRINSKVNISDTANMLLPYLRKNDTTAMLSPYLRKGDTANMLIPYARAANSITLTNGGGITITGGTQTIGASRTWTLTANGSSLFTQTADATVTNTTTETTGVSTGTGSVTLAANALTAGKNIQLRLSGVYSTPVGPGTMTVRVKLGGVTVATTTAFTFSASQTTAGFTIFVDITTRTVGVSGTVMANGWIEYSGGTNVARVANDLTNNGATTTINTTTSNVIDVTYQWSSAASTQIMKTTNFIISSQN